MQYLSLLTFFIALPLCLQSAPASVEQALTPNPFGDERFVDLEEENWDPFHFLEPDPKNAVESPPFPQENKRREVTQSDPEPIQMDLQETAQSARLSTPNPPKTILIDFNNMEIVEYIRFISRLTGRNFVFDQADLDFRVTVVSEEPTTIDNVVTALVQILQIRGLQLIEKDNQFIIHKNPKFGSLSRVSVGDDIETLPDESQLITQVFRLNTLSPERAQAIVTSLLSEQALIETSNTTRHLILTDIVSNIRQVRKLLSNIDSPNAGLIIGQYVVRNTNPDSLISLAQQLIAPIAGEQEFTLVPHTPSNSVFIVSNPYIVEATVSILERLDQTEGETRILDLDELTEPEDLFPEIDRDQPFPPARGQWELSPDGTWHFRPEGTDPESIPQGTWVLDPQGNWYFVPSGQEAPFSLSEEAGTPTGAAGALPISPSEKPRGRWKLGRDNEWLYQLHRQEPIKPKRLTRRIVREEALPLGHIERTRFLLHKLQYRKGSEIVESLQSIGENLRREEGTTNQDLLDSIQSIQWLEVSNSLVIAGTQSAIEKIDELIEQIDQPLRQVFIEMLVLETSITDSLNYGVTWGTRSGGGSTSTQQLFNDPNSSVVGGLNTTGVGATPSATSGTDIGYSLAVIGQRLTHNGVQFASLSAFVTAIHAKGNSDIVLNPKIIVEDNETAEIFVGRSDPFQTQSISNDSGEIITSNIEYRETGSRLKVTPLISNGDLITLKIDQEVSRVAPASEETTSLTPSTSINRTTSTVHMPDRTFVILSGMIDENKSIEKNQVPCLGGIPILGAAFKNRTNIEAKNNLMIFIRPQIVDTYEDYDKLTKRQQEIWKQKHREKKDWHFHVDEALEFLNVAPDCCDVCD